MAPKVIKYVVLAVIMVNVAIIAFVILGGSTPPPQPLPNPNGYDDFVKAAQMIGFSANHYDTMSKEELAGMIATNAETLKLVRLGLSRECREPIEYSKNYSEKLMPELASLKEIAFLFRAEGRLAEIDRRTDDAADIYLEGIRFGQELTHGGLITTRLVGIASEHSATIPLQPLVNSLDAAKCREVAGILQTIDDQEEPITNTLEQQRIYRMKTYGLREKITGLVMYKSRATMTAGLVAKIQANQARRRAMILEFAARAYELEKGKPPQSVADLAPEYLKAVPKDPVTGKDLGLGR